MPCNCNCECREENIYTPNPCNVERTSSNTLRLYTLRCGTWTYTGQMAMNNAPMKGMRLVWEGDAYNIEQSTLVGTEPGLDKWEVMLIKAGPAYYATQPCNSNPYPCPSPEPSPCSDNPYPVLCNEPSPTQPCRGYNVPLGLGCGPHYECNGIPH